MPDELISGLLIMYNMHLTVTNIITKRKVTVVITLGVH